jgi:cold shock CspA family protein
VTLTGFVIRIVKGGGYCFIKATDGVEYFAHRRDFRDKKSMRLSQYVTFIPVPGISGKNPAATSVEAILVSQPKAKVA